MASIAKATNAPATDMIRIRGARTNNLKNVDVDIPRDKFVVITGRSGSGKSSLAMGTLFAEGQRQYIESLSNFARQFFKQRLRAEVDSIDGLQPTLSLQQHVGSANPRSTVGTITEIYDFLRVLMARAGDIHCFKCDQMIRQQTAEEIRDWILKLPAETKVMIASPMVVGRKGKHEDVLAKIRTERLVRVRIDGEVHDIDRLPEIDARKTHTLEAIADRIIVRENIGARLIEAIDLCVRLSDGLVTASYRPPDSASSEWQERVFSTLYACPNCEISYTEVHPRTFSFNSPYGACVECEGIGHTLQFDPDALVPDRSLSIADGAIVPWRTLTKAKRTKQFTALKPALKKVNLDLDESLSKLSSSKFWTLLELMEPQTPGVFALLEKELVTTSDEDRIEEISGFQSQLACKSCNGSRLNKQANAIRIDGKNMGDLTAIPIEEAESYFANLNFDSDRQSIAAPLLSEIQHRLSFLNEVGVGYLTLNRAGDTLSGGEYQRVRLASSIGSGLTNVCYVLDEPSIGLHARDNDRLIRSIRNLQKAGNSIVVVEHDDAMIRAADHVIDMGPGAGSEGGAVVVTGNATEVSKSPESITAKYLNGTRTIECPKRRPIDLGRAIRLKGASGNNLRSVDVAIPLGALVCVTGVSGSGKSTLINQTLAPAVKRHFGLVTPAPAQFDSLMGVEAIDKLIFVDQKPIGRTPRGCAGTYTGVFDEIRNVFASTKESKQRGYAASRFSFNTSSGGCRECKGYGAQRVKMNFLPDMFVTCDECNGKRFNAQTLQVRYRDMTIADVLSMPVRDALVEFENFSKIHTILKCLDEVGLGYLPLGQPSTTLSGGEAQRIKLATELAHANTGKTLYLLDEPTTGLHFEDVRSLITVLNQLVDLGNTMIVIEHNLDVIKSADWVIDLGPEGGSLGGEVIATGTPEEICKASESATGQFLKPILSQAKH